MKNNKFKINSFFNVIYFMLIILSSLIYALIIQINKSFNTTQFDRILYNIINLDNLNSLTSISEPIINGTICFFIFFLISMIPVLLSLIYKKKKYITIKEKKFLIYPISFKYWSIFLFSISIIIGGFTLKVPRFIFNNINYTDLYEKYYVEYNDDLVKFPEKKRNLITIYVESLESSIFSSKNGGIQKKSYMPMLEEMTSKYINFSNNEDTGGFHTFNGTDWTAAALVGITSGIPIYFETKNKNDKFLDGAISLGEVLEDNGYNNYFLMGSNADFADRRKYFLEHGNYEIYDYPKAKEIGWIGKDYYTWWGFEDRKLYSFAKMMLLDLSDKDKPFNFSMLTADTHFYEGYVDSKCPEIFDKNYANSFYCTDLMLNDFITWVQEQDFYDNTTIVIVGDHLTMRDDIFNVSNDYDRVVYNLFINSKVDTDNNKNRVFSTFDIYPTTLASLGATIDGDRLALGTNLFSNEKTLMEELGEVSFKNEAVKASKYYKKNILKKD